MPNRVRDLSFLTVLSLQEADCFRRGEETEAGHLAEFCERLDAVQGPEGSGLKELGEPIVLSYSRALRAATGVDQIGLQELAAALSAQVASIRDMLAQNAAGNAREISPAALRAAMTFLRVLHEQLLKGKREERANRAVRTVLRQRRD